MLMKPYKLSAKVISLLTERLHDEYTAHYFYKNAANWCKNIGYFGGASFFYKEAANELDHAKGIEDYLTDWNVLPELSGIEKPESFSGIVDVIEKSYEIEYDLCEEYKKTASEFISIDLNAFTFIQKYIAIQNESVAEYSDLLNQLALLNISNKFDLFYFDKKVLGKL